GGGGGGGPWGGGWGGGEGRGGHGGDRLDDARLRLGHRLGAHVLAADAAEGVPHCVAMVEREHADHAGRARDRTQRAVQTGLRRDSDDANSVIPRAASATATRNWSNHPAAKAVARVPARRVGGNPAGRGSGRVISLRAGRTGPPRSANNRPGSGRQGGGERRATTHPPSSRTRMTTSR